MISEFIYGFGLFIGYFAVAVILLLMIRAFLKPPKELFRKLLHTACFLSVLVLLYAFDTWYLAMMTAILFALALYPIISYIERFPKIMAILIERKNGEIKSSLLIAFFMMAVLIAIFWGLLGEQWKFIVVVSIMAWGFGDAAAALIGKAFGRNPINHRWVEGTKTREGSIAMYFVSAASIFICLLIYTSFSWYLCISGALLIAPICTIVELVSRNGMDTITVPLATAFPVFSLMLLLSSVGV